MLHLHPGDYSGAIMEKTDVSGDVVVVWTDLLEQGPTPAGVTPEEWWSIRAEFLTAFTGGALEHDMVVGHHRKQDEALEDFVDHEEVVLWFDACMYDQVILIHHLDFFSRQQLGDTTLSLICIGDFPGFERFRGIGELSPEQMASLIDTRHEVTVAETELSVEAWHAFTSPDPREIEYVLHSDTAALPFLSDALIRHLEEFPSTVNGLSRLQSEALECLCKGGSLPELYGAVSEMEERPYFGDTTLWSCFTQLSQAEEPAVLIEGPGPLPRWAPPKDLSPWNVAITETGRAVLAGDRDWIELNGIDAWVGGVHLTQDNLWRWNLAERRLISC